LVFALAAAVAAPSAVDCAVAALVLAVLAKS
jgi:hypothetical protein